MIINSQNSYGSLTFQINSGFWKMIIFNVGEGVVK